MDNEKVIRIRVEASWKTVEAIATAIGEAMEDMGHELVDQSTAHANRNEPDKARVYLTLR